MTDLDRGQAVGRANWPSRPLTTPDPGSVPLIGGPLRTPTFTKSPFDGAKKWPIGFERTSERAYRKPQQRITPPISGLFAASSGRPER